MSRKVLVPPDGGWGWMIVLASALSNLVIIPIMQSFGLIFKETFATLGLSHTDRSTIVNMNSAFGMVTGLINGILLRQYGLRKVAIAGAILVSCGIVLTSFAKSFMEYVVYYGLITSLGMGFCISSYSLALNMYFTKNRNRATGIALTVTGLGPILMPQLISYLMSVNTPQETIFIIGGISLNCFVSALLMQPVKWHMKEAIEEENGAILDDAPDKCEETEDKIERHLKPLLEEDVEAGPPKRRLSLQRHRRRSSLLDSRNSMAHDVEVNAIYGFDTPLAGSVLSLTPGSQRVTNRKYSTPELTVNKWWSTSSLNTINLGSSIKIFDEKGRPATKALDVNRKNSQPEDSVYKELSVKAEEKKEESVLRNIAWTLIKFFDLTLLCDPIYLNIMLGMSLAIFAELNFSILTPFILADFGLTTNQSATFLSILSVADLIFRFFAPFIGEFLKKPPRIMYMLSLLCLAAARFSLLWFSEYSSLLGVAVVLGITKGIRTVYMNLVIPSYVPIERLATAAGLQMMVNGVFILIGGVILGIIRDVTGSYRSCIVVMNFVTLSCLLMWMTEMLIVKFRKPKPLVNGENLSGS